MKKLIVSVLALVPLCATAQYNPETLRTAVAQPAERVEFILPVVNGYNIYKVDLHTHSIYSDGETTPAFRIKEAYMDGLDAIAIQRRRLRTTVIDCPGSCIGSISGSVAVVA